MKKTMKDATKLAHLGRDVPHAPKTVNVPVHRASTVVFDSIEELHRIQREWDQDAQVATYGVFNMPQQLALENAVAEIEHGYRAFTYPSGLAAVAGALLACVKPGDHVLMVDNCYGPARMFCDGYLKRMNVATTYYDPLIGAGIASLMQPNTTVVYTESPGSLTFEVQDLRAVADAAHARHASVITDNAWATGLYFNAFAHGADLVVQPATKYYAGHSDVLIGLVVANESHWPRLKSTAYDMGQRASPDDCFLALRGMRTMQVRMERHQQTALRVAQWLEAQPDVARVHYPALPSHPQHALWKRDFTGAAGLFTVEMQPGAKQNTKQQLAAMLDHYRYFALGYSWGGFESLAVPAFLVNRLVPHQGGELIRYSIGLEDPDDLIADLAQGLERWRAAE
jgi:cysteine-S-conjugate beta-lyase